mmetsp:Transcript_4718/g.8765  ORF Transcript_4718/g.8765 Transcript_4718/m.8765 type:complete len:84 (+) Transcript_4718:2247-2498(+)
MSTMTTLQRRLLLVMATFRSATRGMTDMTRKLHAEFERDWKMARTWAHIHEIPPNYYEKRRGKQEEGRKKGRRKKGKEKGKGA